MKDIINFCRMTNRDYVIVGLPNGDLRATIECEKPFDAIKIKEMAKNRGFADVTTQIDISEDDTFDTKKISVITRQYDIIQIDAMQVVITVSKWTDPLDDMGF